MHTTTKKIGENKIRITGNIIELPCLAGRDVSRERGTICVEVDGGNLFDAAGGDPLTIEPSGKLLGWGSLDGEAVDLVYRSGKFVSVPSSLIDHLRQEHGLIA